MLEPRRKPGPKPTDGPKAANAGISLYPSETEVIDRLVSRFGVRSRGEVVRRLIADHPEARQLLTTDHLTATA